MILIADEAKKAKDRLRTALQAEMDAIGADRVKAEYGDDVIAYVTTTKPKFKWVIKSDKRFVDWVKNNIPSEIVESVRESSVDAILDKFNYLDDMVIDPTKRITVVQYERDEMKEELMLSRLRDASEFYSQYMQQLINK